MPRVRTQEARGPCAGHPSHGTCACVLGDREEADRTQANRKSHGRRKCTWGINATAAPLSSESRSSLHHAGAKPTHQVQSSSGKATNYSRLRPLHVANAQLLMNIFQSLQEGWHFNSPADDDPESGARCGGHSSCQTPQCS